MDDFVRSYLDRHNIPSAAVAVVKDGRIIKSKGYGNANLELRVAATDSTIYEIGSISKQFTAEAVILLIDEGKLRLDDPIQKYLKDIPPSWSKLTVWHLLTHTSGLPDWESKTQFSYRREYTPTEFIKLLAPLPLEFPPGDRWSYTNSGYPLLGMIIEAITGTGYEQFVTERIFLPAGMYHTRFKHPEEIVPNRSGGYVDHNGLLQNGEPLRPRVIAPNGGIMSTALDIARWDIALTNGVLLRPATLAQMMKPIRLNNGSMFDEGFSWFIDTFRGHPLFLHNGSTVAGFSSVVYRYPDDHLGVVVLLNIDRWNAVNVLATRIASFFVPGLSTLGLPELPDPDSNFSLKLLALLADVAANKDSEMLAPSLRNPSGPPRTTSSFGFKGPLTKFAFLDKEDFGKNGVEHFGNTIRWILRYKLTTVDRVRYYTFDITPDGKVARFFPEEG
jgi:CubicO group peptidase (beta-lactamase class C family)